MTIEKRLDPHRQPWMTEAGVRAVFAAIQASGGAARFVGGAVRDALLGHDVGDVDLATDLPPEKTAAALTAAGLKAVPTGMDHGTVTAVVDHKGYEITTLRRDVEAYGRHAKVAFTDDWQADAARRDFTFNALYADCDGTVYDYFGGIEDLKAGRVRFIREAEDRIREDVLRILRFFRFYAWFGRTEADEEALQACRNSAPLLKQLSAERIWMEVRKWLQAPDPVKAWRLIIDNGILPHFLPEAANGKRLERLVAAEKSIAPDSLRRLAALLPTEESVARAIAQRLHFSNRESERLSALIPMPAEMEGNTDPRTLRQKLYKHGAENVRDGLLLLAAYGKTFDLARALDVVRDWQAPVFPLQGGDLLRAGVAQGPQIGEILRAVEDWWLSQDFAPEKESCLAEALRRACVR